MSPDHRAIVCRPASPGLLPFTPRFCLWLSRWGPHANLSLHFDDVSRAVWADVPAVFTDLLDIATYVYAADQAIPRGTDKDEHFGLRWRRSLHFAIPVRKPGVWG